MQQDNAYLCALRSLASDPRLQSPISGGGEIGKEIWICCQCSQIIVDINVKNVQEWAILDSGATSHLLVSAVPTSNVRPAITHLTVELPDGAHIKSTAKYVHTSTTRQVVKNLTLATYVQKR